MNTQILSKKHRRTLLTRIINSNGTDPIHAPLHMDDACIINDFIRDTFEITHTRGNESKHTELYRECEDVIEDFIHKKWIRRKEGHTDWKVGTWKSTDLGKTQLTIRRFFPENRIILVTSIIAAVAVIWELLKFIVGLDQ